MRQTELIIIDKETIAPAWWRLTLAAQELAPQLLPGQFLLARCADYFTCYLRRPIFPFLLDQDRLGLLLRPGPDLGLAWLAARQPGDKLDVIGPLGAGFPLPDHTGNLVLASDTQSIGPLLGQMRRAMDAGISVTLALGGSRAAALYPLQLLPPAVEVQLATHDGSAGHRGPLTDLLPALLRWADTVCACGTPTLYRLLINQAGQVRLGSETGFLYGLVSDGLLACGVGACLGCTIQTKAGLKLTCLDGPVFDLMDLGR